MAQVQTDAAEAAKTLTPNLPLVVRDRKEERTEPLRPTVHLVEDQDGPDPRWGIAAGTSGEPHIPNGSQIYITPASGFVDGQRYAVWIGDAEADVVKRVSLGGNGSVTLHADNGRVPPLMISPTADPELWRLPDGGTLRVRVQGSIAFPPDAPAAISGTVAALAASLIADAH